MGTYNETTDDAATTLLDDAPALFLDDAPPRNAIVGVVVVVVVYRGGCMDDIRVAPKYGGLVNNPKT